MEYEKKRTYKQKDFKRFCNSNTEPDKGQFNSEWIYEVLFLPKCQPKITKISALPSNKLSGQKSSKCLVGILGKTMTSKIHSDFNWPLVFIIHTYIIYILEQNTQIAKGSKSEAYFCKIS